MRTQVAGFFAEIPRVLFEMRHQQGLYRRLQAMTWLHGIPAWVAHHTDIWKSISFLLALLINALVLMCYERTGLDTSPFCADSLLQNHVGFRVDVYLIQPLGALQVCAAPARAGA